jgi:hypothetical protein
MYHCTLGPLGLTLREPHANGAGHLVSGLVAGGMAEMKGVQTGRSVGRLVRSRAYVCCVLISVSLVDPHRLLCAHLGSSALALARDGCTS